MNLIKLIIAVFLVSQGTYAQSWEVKISGSLINPDDSLITGIPVVLLENKDTLISVKTDQQGKFNFSSSFSYGNDYVIVISEEKFKLRSNKVYLFQKTDTARMSEYQLDLIIPKIIRDKFDNSAYYNLNETTNFQNFEIQLFKELMDEYPGMCVEFTQTIHPEEKSKVAAKRMKRFREQLEKAGYDLSRISFRKEVLVLNKDLLKTDSRSRIQGIVLSMDGDCKK